MIDIQEVIDRGGETIPEVPLRGRHGWFRRVLIRQTTAAGFPVA
jgi:hypothetical protein